MSGVEALKSGNFNDFSAESLPNNVTQIVISKRNGKSWQLKIKNYGEKTEQVIEDKEL